MQELNVCAHSQITSGTRFSTEVFWSGDGYGASHFYGSSCSDVYLDVDVSHLSDEDMRSLVGRAAELSMQNRGPVTFRIHGKMTKGQADLIYLDDVVDIGVVGQDAVE